MNKVTGYSAGWNVKMHKGRVIIQLDGEVGEPDLGWFEAAEFHAIVDLLRNEEPLYYDRQSTQLETLTEAPGEGEHQPRKAKSVNSP